MIEDMIFDLLNETQKNSTQIDDGEPTKLVFKRDAQGNLWSYNEETGERVGRIFEHGNDTTNVAKTFSEIIRKE